MKKMSVLLFVFALGCGGASTSSDVPAGAKAQDNSGQGDAGASEEQTAPAPEQGPVEISSVTRQELDALLGKGVPTILGMVQTDSVVSDGRFVGFRIVSFRNGAESVLGLKGDDVLTAVNGMPIARPEQMIALVEKMKKATEVSFSVIRSGEPQTLTTPVQ